MGHLSDGDVPGSSQASRACNTGPSDIRDETSRGEQEIDDVGSGEPDPCGRPESQPLLASRGLPFRLVDGAGFQTLHGDYSPDSSVISYSSEVPDSPQSIPEESMDVDPANGPLTETTHPPTAVQSEPQQYSQASFKPIPSRKPSPPKRSQGIPQDGGYARRGLPEVPTPWYLLDDDQPASTADSSASAARGTRKNPIDLDELESPEADLSAGPVESYEMDEVDEDYKPEDSEGEAAGMTTGRRVFKYKASDAPTHRLTRTGRPFGSL
jgi:hypothetical protein